MKGYNKNQISMKYPSKIEIIMWTFICSYYWSDVYVFNRSTIAQLVMFFVLFQTEIICGTFVYLLSGTWRYLLYIFKGWDPLLNGLFHALNALKKKRIKIPQRDILQSIYLRYRMYFWIIYPRVVLITICGSPDGCCLYS